MCSRYEPVLQRVKLSTYFRADDPPPFDLNPELWPGYIGLFICKHEFADVGDEAVPFRELMVGSLCHASSPKSTY